MLRKVTDMEVTRTIGPTGSPTPERRHAPRGASGRRSSKRATGSSLTYLVTGGAGFIGSHLADRLVARGQRVIALDDLKGGSPANLAGALASGRAELVEGSVLDRDLVERCMSEADFCVHLAAALGVTHIVDRPLSTLLSNVRGADIVMATAHGHGVPLLFASSSEVYGKQSAPDLREDADCTIGAPSRSRWSYAIAKQFGESLVNAYVQDAGAQMAAVRFFNIVGARQNGAYGMVLTRFVDQALAGEPLTVHGDGSQSRCFTSVHDAVSAVDGLLRATLRAGAIYNVGASSSIRVDDLARRVIARTASRSGITYVPYVEAYGPGYEELGRRNPDTSTLRAETGWTALRSLDEVIDEVVATRGRAAAPVPVVTLKARGTGRLTPARATA
ncbi:MAG TPA: NAD-dependent epimerase/dehydratase family protein [Solirubrobacteraceae bacterium]|nr:NAD-dependent epimerase/dehydratase family protein [Solirubrobacteraceae bacterium]